MSECDPEVFRKGNTVFLLSSRQYNTNLEKVYKPLTNNDLEYLCKEVGKETGVKMDWHCVGGRDNVLALNSREKVQKYIVGSNKWVNWFEKRGWKKEYLEYQQKKYNGNFTAPNAYHLGWQK